MAERIALYPGTFDPVTNGHLDIISRAARLVDRLVIGVAINIGKGPLFELAERVELVQAEVKPIAARTGTTIEVRLRRSDGVAQIAVADNGPGIPAEQLPQLWNRFYRGDKARSRASGGAGLGLAIVKYIAEAHGGRVAITSEVGQGATFTITLPVMPSVLPA